MDTVKLALKVGYRHLDLAVSFYFPGGIGKAHSVLWSDAESKTMVIKGSVW